MMPARLLNANFPVAVEASLSSAICMRSHSWRDWDHLRPVWTELSELTPDATFFLSCEWVEAWLDTFGRLLEPSILLFRSGVQAVGIALLVKTRVVKGFIPLQSFSLNTTGEPREDTAYSEYNSLVCRPEWQQAVTASLCTYLHAQHWDQVVLQAFTPGPVFDGFKAALANTRLDEVTHSSYFVDLAALRHDGLRFEASLQPKYRKHLRQNIRYHEEAGPLAIHRAANREEALVMLDELAELSQARWSKAGRDGMYGSAAFRSFNRRLVNRCIPEGTAELVRVTAGGQTVGTVLNLLHRGRVYFYQCGYRYSADKRLSPGTVALSQVVQFYLDRGFERFDFLSGESSYKRWLSNAANVQVWATFRRPTWRNAAVKHLRRAKAHMTHALERTRKSGGQA